MLLGALTLLAGCSSYQATKLNTAGDLPTDAKAGVPFVMTKPEFAVKKLDGTDSDQYQVGINYVPDPHQRFTLKLSPALLASVDFNVALGDTGSLTSAAAVTNDQIVPTTLALFKVAASVASAVGTGGLLSLQSPNSVGDCLTQKSGLVLRTTCVLKRAESDQACKVSAKPIEDRLSRYTIDGNDKGPGLDSLYIANGAEGDCLKAADKQVSDYVDTFIKPGSLSQSFDTSFSALAVSSADPARTAIAAAVDKAISVGDPEALKRLAYGSAETSDNAEQEAVYTARMTKLTSSPVLLTKADLASLAQALTNTQFMPAIRGNPNLDMITELSYAKSIQKAFADAAKLKPAEQKARVITELQAQLADAQAALLPRAGTIDVEQAPEIVRLRSQIASLAGVQPEYTRMVRTEWLLARMPLALSPTAHVSPASEADALAKQVSALHDTINLAIASALSAGAPQSKKAAALPLSSPWVDAGCLDKSKSEAWRYTDGLDTPEFVVVLRRQDGTALSPPTYERDLCGAPGNS